MHPELAFTSRIVLKLINKVQNVEHEKGHHIYIDRFYTNLDLAGGPPLWSSGQRSWLQIQRSRVRFPAIQDFLRSSGSGTGSTQPNEDN
jgi:hypothetical protein